ncbi:MAG: Rab family GTPase [Candidatus Odinarchaeota archaeon]
MNSRVLDRASWNFKLLLLGEGAVGKTSLILHHIAKMFFSDYRPTFGADFVNTALDLDPDNVTVNLQIWDSAGKEEFSSFTKLYLTGVQGVFLVFDVTRRETFTKLADWSRQVDRFSPDAVKILIGNKIDLIHDQKVSEEEMLQHVPVLSATSSLLTSAKTGEQVDEAFFLLARFIFKHLVDRA